MRWELSEEQTMVSEAFGDWVEHVATSAAVRDWVDSGDPEAFEKSLTEQGWLGVGFDEAAGGQGGGLIELALLAEQLGRRTAPGAAWLASVLALPALAGDDDAISEVIGGGFAALTVPADGPADVAASSRSADGTGPRARVAADGNRLSGAVSYVLGADRARMLVVPVVTTDGIRWWRVAADDPAVTMTPHRLLDGSRSVADVELDGVAAIPLATAADSVLAQAALRAAVLVAADSLGTMVRLLDMTVEYSGQRQQFGHPIGSFQAVQHATAQMLVDVEAARSITYLAAEAVESGHPDAVLYAAATKAQVTAAGVRCADAALTVHGAIGYTWEYDLQLSYKRAGLNRELGGSPEVWNERLATALPLLPDAPTDRQPR